MKLLPSLYKTSVIILLLISVWVKTQSFAANDLSRPNVLLIISDQYRFDIIKSVQDDLSHYDGKTKIRTPNLDRLRAEGVYFEKAYTQCAVCGPARSVLRTGKTIESNGVQSNDLTKSQHYTLDNKFKNKIESNVTFDMVLVENRGYKAENYGKWHQPEIYNWSRDGSTRIMRYNDADFTAMTHDNDYGNIVYSFDNNDSSLNYSAKLAAVVNNIDTNKYNYYKGLGKQNNTYSKFPYVPDRIDTRFNEPNYKDPNQNYKVGQPDQQGRNTLPANRTSSYFEGLAILGALDRMGDASDPFLLTASFHNPHAPMIATGLYYDYYDAIKGNFFVPPSFNGQGMNNNDYSMMNDTDYQNEAKIKEWMVSYYALCEEVDVYIGKLLDKLDERGLTDNTLVIFTADHGEALGSHGTREKNTFLEESARVPLLMRYPNGMPAGLKISEPVTTLDVYATMLDYTGSSQYDNGDGKSLRRFIDKTSYNKDYDEEHIVTEWDFRTPNSNGGLDRSLGGEVNFLSMKHPWKLMMSKKRNSDKKDMLFNVNSDPFEMNNRIGNNGANANNTIVGKAEHLRALLIEWMQRHDGNQNNYSDKKWNNNEGNGDIAEIRARRSWKTVNFWVSDSQVNFGPPVDVGGQFTRNEWIYFGRTNANSINVNNVTVQGADANKITLAGFTSGSIASGAYKKLKVIYRPDNYGDKITDARVVIRHSGSTDVVVNLGSENFPVTPALDAQFVSVSAPSTVAPGADFTASVTFKNTGTSDWTNADGFKIGSQNPQDNSIWGSNRVLMDAVSTTANGENYTFTTTFTAPATEGTYDFQWKLLQEGVEWFGPVSQNAQILVMPEKPENLEDKTDEAGATIISNTVASDAAYDVTNAFDNDAGTKFQTANASASVEHRFAAGNQYTLKWYSVTSAAEGPLEYGSNNLIANGAFENALNASSNWTQSPSGNATLSTNQSQGGSQSLRLSGNGSISPTTQTLTLTPNTDYEVRVWAMNPGQTAGRAIFDTTDKFDSPTGPSGPGGSAQFVLDVGDAGAWTEYVGTFNSGSETSVTLRLFTNADFAGTMFFDSVSLRIAQSPGNAVPHDPASWILSGSNDGSVWEQLDSRSGITFASRGETREFSAVSNTTAYEHYRIEFTNNGGSMLQLSEVELWCESAGVIDPELDPDKDGMPNLLEFALGGDPNQSDADVVLPAVTKEASSFDMKFRRAENSVTYIIQKSTDLQVWTDHITVDDSHGLVGTDATVPVSLAESVNGKLFLRLKVEN